MSNHSKLLYKNLYAIARWHEGAAGGKGRLTIDSDTVSMSQRGCMDKFTRLIVPFDFMDNLPVVKMVSLSIEVEEVDPGDMVFNPLCADHYGEFGFSADNTQVNFKAKCVVCDEPAVGLGTQRTDQQQTHNCLECNWSGPAWPHVQGNMCPVCGTKAIALEGRYHVS